MEISSCFYVVTGIHGCYFGGIITKFVGLPTAEQFGHILMNGVCALPSVCLSVGGAGYVIAFFLFQTLVVQGDLVYLSSG